MAVVERQIEAQKELGRQLAKYAGRWVAVADDRVVAAGKTPEAVFERTKGQKIERVFRVPKTSGSVLL